VEFNNIITWAQVQHTNLQAKLHFIVGL